MIESGPIPSRTVTNDAGIVASRDISASAQRDVVGRDSNLTINNNFDQRSVTEAQIQRLESLKNRIDQDVNILVRVRLAFGKISDLEAPMARGVDEDPRAHIAEFRLLAKWVLDELIQLDRNLRGTGSDAYDLESNLFGIHKNLERLSDQSIALGPRAPKVSAGIIAKEFTDLVSALKDEIGRLRTDIGSVADDFYNDARNQVAMLHGVINDLRQNLMESRGLNSSESRSFSEASGSAHHRYSASAAGARGGMEHAFAAVSDEFTNTNIESAGREMGSGRAAEERRYD